MRWAWAGIAALLVVASSCVSGQVEPGPANADLLSLGVDSRSPLESRIGSLPSEITKRNEQFKLAPWTDHPLTDRERKKLAAALRTLTPLQARALREHLRTISFVDGMASNGQTLRVIRNDDVSHDSFDIVFRAGLLDETISQFATRKERQLFDTVGSSLSVSIEAGSMDAIVFVLLHESTHGVDDILHLTPQTNPFSPIPEADQTAFTRGIWESGIQPVATYRSPLLDSSFFKTGKLIPIAQAQAFYEDLKRTPFPSAYANSQAVEDLPELVALWRLTEKYKQPFRIVIRDGERVVYSYEPMKSPLVRSRLDQLARFNSTNLE